MNKKNVNIVKKREQDNTKKIDWIYSQLEDEESKFIFNKRRLFNVDRNYKYIHEIIDNYVQELKEYKWYPGKEQELVYDIKKKCKKVVIFGAGINGKRVWEVCKGQIKVDFFCDNNRDKQGMQIDGIEIISFEKLMNMDGIDDYLIIVSPKYACEEIVTLLLNKGIKEENIYRFIKYGVISLDRVQYFDKEIISFKNDEVFVDGGAFDLGTTGLFAKKCKTFKKIFAFEPDNECYLKCKNNAEKIVGGDINLVCAGLWSENGHAEFMALGNGSSRIVFSEKSDLNTIEVIALDSYISEKVTFIKMDVEGAELEALKGAKKIIERDMPKLAICLYHRDDDIWEIPYYIKKLVPEYKLYIRHYSNYQCETVLYAVCEKHC